LPSFGRHSRACTRGESRLVFRLQAGMNSKRVCSQRESRGHRGDALQVHPRSVFAQVRGTKPNLRTLRGQARASVPSEARDDDPMNGKLLLIDNHGSQPPEVRGTSRMGTIGGPTHSGRAGGTQKPLIDPDNFLHQVWKILIRGERKSFFNAAVERKTSVRSPRQTPRRAPDMPRRRPAPRSK
jgi:hypothetical protein